MENIIYYAPVYSYHSSPDTPSSGFERLYPKSDNNWYSQDSSNVEHGFLYNIGNSFGSAINIGSNDSNDVSLRSNNNDLLWLKSSGQIGVGTNNPNLGFDVNTDFAIRKGTDNNGTGTLNNVSSASESNIRFTNNTAPIITGFANGHDGKILTISNVGAGTLVINNNDSGSSAANRIITGTGYNYNLNTGASVTLQYDAGATVWRITGSSNYVGQLGFVKVLITDSQGMIVSSSTSTTQLSYLDATSSIQTQLNNLYPLSNPNGYISTISGITAGGDLTGTYPNPTITTNVVTYSKFQQIGAYSLLGNTNSTTGNIGAITIGTGLSLSGGILSNTATYTSPLTTKGDIFVRNSTTDTRLGVGTDGYVLIANSGQSTGLSWGLASSGLLTGYVSGSGSITSADTILSAIQKLNGNISLVTGAIVYQGLWNASTNTPTLTSGTGTKGYMYKVNVAGTTTLDGISQWNVGDQVIFDGTTWDKIDGLANEVISFNTRVGAITLTSSDVNSSFGNITANYVYAGPASGSAATPGFRLQVANDIPGTLNLTSFSGSITSSMNTGAISYGTLNFSDTNNFAVFETNVNSYAQIILQNVNTGGTASTDIIVGNSSMTSSNNFGNFGINSTAFSGSGAFNQPNNVYLTSTGVDLAIGTTSSNKIHFVINNGITDALTILSTGQLVAPQFYSNAGFVQTDTSGNITSASLTSSQVTTALGFTPFSNPMTTKGDLLYENATPTAARLAIGGTNTYLTVASGLPVWSSQTLSLTGNFATTGAFNLTFAVPQSTTYTLPNTALETLAGLGTAQTFSVLQTIAINSIGSTSTNALLLQNTTAAANNSQQFSPSIIWAGNGWSTTGTPNSQSVLFKAEGRPTQSTSANPRGTWALSYNVNSAGWSDIFTIDVFGNTTTLGTVQAAVFSVLNYISTSAAQITSTGTFTNFSSVGAFIAAPKYTNTTTGAVYNFKSTFAASSTSSNGTAYGFYSDLSNLTVSVSGAKYAFYNADAASPSQFTANSITNTSTDQIILANTTATTSGSTVQWSPRTRYQGHAWNTTVTAADNFLDLIQELQTVSGTSPSLNFVTSGRVSTSGTGAFTAMTYLNYTGTTTNFGINVSPSATIHAKGQDSTSSNYALRIDSSTVNNLLTVRDDGQINIGNSTNYYANVNIAGATTTVSHLYLSPITSAFSGTMNDGMFWYQNVSSVPRYRVVKGTAGVTDIITALANQDFTNANGSKAAEFNINGDLTNARYIVPYGAGATYNSYSTAATTLTDLWNPAAWNGNFVLNGNTNITNPQLSTGQVYKAEGYMVITTPSSLGTNILFNFYLGGTGGTLIASVTLPVSGTLSASTAYKVRYSGLFVVVSSTSVQFMGELIVLGSTSVMLDFSSASNAPITGLTLSTNQQLSFSSTQTIGGGAASNINSLPGAYLFPVI